MASNYMTWQGGFGRSTEAHQPPPEVTPGSDEPLAGARLAGLRVLLVDDNRINLMVAGKALELEGAHVETAGDGQKALDRLRNGPTDFDAVPKVEVAHSFTA